MTYSLHHGKVEDTLDRTWRSVDSLFHVLELSDTALDHSDYATHGFKLYRNAVVDFAAPGEDDKALCPVLG